MQYVLYVSEEDSVIAFTVAHAETKTYLRDERLEFPVVITNEGGGYSPSQNEFLCPVTGLYLFTVTVTRNRESNNAIVDIVMDDELLVTVFAASSSNAGTSAMVFIRCQSGQRVYAQCTGLQSCTIRSETDGWERSTTFSGLLIASDD